MKKVICFTSGVYEIKTDKQIVAYRQQSHDNIDGACPGSDVLHAVLLHSCIFIDLIGIVVDLWLDQNSSSATLRSKAQSFPVSPSINQCLHLPSCLPPTLTPPTHSLDSKKKKRKCEGGLELLHQMGHFSISFSSPPHFLLHSILFIYKCREWE